LRSVEYPAIEDVLLIHRRVIEETGGSHGVRSIELLESALHRPRAGFGDEEFYPELFSKAAAMFESVILNHPFVDGNKRTATVTVEFFVELNGWTLVAPDRDFEDFAVHVAESKPALEKIEEWLRGHSSPSGR
jgi:death-on-curing protein